MKVYISGKIGEAAISEATRQKFARAEEMLRAKGHEPFNPCSEEWQAHLRRRYEEDSRVYQPYIDGGGMPDFYTYALLRDMMALSCKDAIYLLQDWKESAGARAERVFCLAVGKRFFFEDRFDACECLVKEMYGLVRMGKPPGEWLEFSRTEAEIRYAERRLHLAWLPLK